MFKSARWRTDKNKIKAVFKLHFHATQVSQLDGHALMISVVPPDFGKPTVRLEKVTVQDGSCYWEKPVYETVKFVRDPKTEKIHERIYHFVVATGSSKVGLVGEVSVDFANYAFATKLSSVSLPLKNAKSEAKLHVSIQRMQDSVDQSEVDESENAKLNSQDRSLRAQLSNVDTDESIKSNSTEDGHFNMTVSHVSELNGNGRVSSGSDLTISSSESSFGLDIVSRDDLSNSPRETLSRETSREASGIMIEKLKTELALLSRQAEVSELEIQTLRKQIVKESKRGQDLSRELATLKAERDDFKDECGKLNSSLKRVDELKVKNKLQFEGGYPWALIEELREEINYEKDLNANLRLQLQKTQESNSELILAVRDLDEMLEQKHMETVNLSNESKTSESAKVSRQTNMKCETDDDDDDDEEQRALEELVKGHGDGNEAYLLEQKIVDLYSEIEISRREKDEVEMQMEQLALDYEILKQENHKISYKLEQSQLQEQLNTEYECSTSYETLNDLETQIESLENELLERSKEFSDSLVTIKELENHVKSLEEDLENQAQGFEADLEVLMGAKIEQEQRAIRAEETLRKARWQNGNTAERLQEEFRRLSEQMASTFEANEKLAMKALAEANELRIEKSHLEEMLKKAKEDLESVRDLYEAKLFEVSSKLTSNINQMEKMKMELEDKSMELERQRKHGEETHRFLLQEIPMHRAEIEKLTAENKILSEQAEERENLKTELEEMKVLIKETGILVERGITEKNELESMVDLVKMEEEKLVSDLNRMRALKDEKESMIGNLKSKLETLKIQCDDLRHSSLEGELEKEKLRKLVSQLKGDLKKKEDAISSIEKKLKDSNGRVTVLEGIKATSRNSKSVSAPRGSKEVANLKEKIKLLEGQIKLKEAALETSANSFLEKENDLQNQIEELDRRFEVLTQNTASFCRYEFEKVTRDTEDPTSRTTNGKVCPVSPINSNDDILSEKEPKACSTNTREEVEVDELSNETALLKERNEKMEGELKEMQERYSEISLKFAEVEGERQQLVMTLRNLKNATRS